MIEDGGAYPSRGEPDAGAAPPGPPRYPEWPSAGHAPDAGDQPTNVYAALSDLAPADVEPGEILVPPPGHGQPVPRDFVPPQVTWSPAPEPLYFDGSLVHWNSGPEPAAPIERFEQRREDWRPAYQPPAQRRPVDAGPPSPDPSDPRLTDPRLADPWPTDARLSDPRPGDPRSTDSRLPAPRPPGPGLTDPGLTAVGPVVGPAVEWVPAAETEVFDGPLIDLSAPRPLPVTHRGRRRRGHAVVAVAAVGAVLAGATGYAVLRGLGVGPATHTDASRPLTTAAPTSGPPSDAIAPADPVSIPPSAGARQSTSAAASPSRTVTITPAPGSTAVPTQGSQPSPPPMTTPAQTQTPLSGRPAPTLTPSSAPAGLVGSLRSEESNGSYLGTVSLSNRGASAASNWTVRVTAAGATAVVVVGGGVNASRSGDTLTFTGSSIAAGGSLTFAFAVSGASSAPTGCQVNGSACS